MEPQFFLFKGLYYTAAPVCLGIYLFFGFVLFFSVLRILVVILLISREWSPMLCHDLSIITVSFGYSARIRPLPRHRHRATGLTLTGQNENSNDS